MKNLWSDSEAAQFTDDLAQRVYTSRLLGRDRSLVLHGGGNTSVKIAEKNIFGEPVEILYVKGSGWDLEHIEKGGFSPVKLDHAARLATLSALSDPQMVNELKSNMTLASAPVPSVEAILHAIVPFKYVDHTHADSVLAVMNAPNGKINIQEIYGNSVVIVDYIMPGFDLSRIADIEFKKQATDKTIGMILMNHGVFSFGGTARESYERMIYLVDLAEKFLIKKNAWNLSLPATDGEDGDVNGLLKMRSEISALMGKPAILYCDRSDKALGYCRSYNVAVKSQKGPVTPDHIIRTKKHPALSRDIEAFSAGYKKYFDTNSKAAREKKEILDSAPRIILDSEFGVIAVGKNAKDARINAEIYDHTIDVIERANMLGGYVALPEKDLFDMEYWDLEQAKLKSGGKSPVLEGQIALVTGAASGIGAACVKDLLHKGVAVVGVDINPSIVNLHRCHDFLGIQCDLTASDAVPAALRKAAETFGGLDLLILNAGVFPESTMISQITAEAFQKVLDINLNANLYLLKEAYPFLKASPGGKNVVVVGSKNVAAPGPGAAAYSVSKAAMNQLVRVTALEWAKDGIRINSVHPNSVFDTGIWKPEILTNRAKAYNLTVEEYMKNNLLKTNISSADVAAVVSELCLPVFSKTTACGIPIDGGNDRVI